MSVLRKFLTVGLIILSAYSVKAQAPNPNTPPVLNSSIPVQEVYYGKYFEFNISENTFLETDQNDRIVKYEAVLFNGDNLPKWIFFNKDELKFWGRPEKQNKGEYFITLKAYDSHNAIAITEFYLIVK